MKSYVYIRVKGFSLYFGWASDETIALLKLNLLEADITDKGKLEHLTILEIQILKLFLQFGFS